MLRFPDGSMSLLNISLEVFLQDHLAHKKIWHCKGASGWIECMKCVNKTSVQSELASQGDRGLVDDVLDDTKLVLHTDDTIRYTVERLKAAKAIDDDPIFALREQALGFNHCEHSIL